MKKTLCIVSAVVNFIFLIISVVLLLSPDISEDWITRNTDSIFIFEVIWVVVSLIVGAVIFKLDIDCLMKKYEDTGMSLWEKTLMLAVFSSVGAIIFYNVCNGFFLVHGDAEMLSSDILLQLSTVVHLLLGYAGFLAAQYFDYIGKKSKRSPA